MTLRIVELNWLYLRVGNRLKLKRNEILSEQIEQFN